MSRRLTSEEREMYSRFVQEFPFCMACGWRQRGYRSWCMPNLENAHIVGGSGRVADRRAIVRLCNGCHLLNHCHTIRIAGKPLPFLELGHMLTLKAEFDPDNFDIEFLMSLRIRSKERIAPVPLPTWFISERGRWAAR